MIKVNLNKTKSSTIYSQSVSSESVHSTIFTNIKKRLQGKTINISPAILIKMVINLILIACFPLGLKIYELREIKKLNDKKKKEEQVLANEQKKLAILTEELGKYDHLQDKSKEFTDKMDFLKDLAETRLIVPQTIDLIQDKIPKTVWLESLSLNISTGKNILQIEGQSLDEADVNAFAASLHDILNENSIVVNTRDVKESNSVVRVKFKLEGEM